MLNRKVHTVLASVVLLTSLFALNSEAGYTEPGSETDPLVTKSYVDKKYNEIKSGIKVDVENGVKSNLGNTKDKIDKLERDIQLLKLQSGQDKGESTQTVSSQFAVLELKRGQRILADESTEIIVRAGVTNAISSKTGGISDITEGKDLSSGEEIKLNHLLIVPRSDGRGLEVKSHTVFVMIKGKYKVS